MIKNNATDLEIVNPGAIPSLPDYRDQFVAQAIGDIPPTLPTSFKTPFPDAWHQRKIPACVNHAIYKLGQYYWFKKTGQLINFSPRFGDVLCKRFDGQPLDGGTYPRLAAKLACEYGLATEATVKNDTTLPLSVYRQSSILTPEAFAEASKYKLPGYVMVPVSKNTLRQSILKYGAIAILLPIGEEWWTAKSGQSSWDKKDIMPLRRVAITVSGHEVVQNGWDNDDLERLLNSWSKDWADNGENVYSLKDYAPIEALAIAEIPTDIKQKIKGMPSPGSFRHLFLNDLQSGQSGDDVRALQIALAIENCFTYQEITGFFGSVTQKAVIAFQQKYGITPAVGYVGTKTRTMLNYLYNR